MQQADPLAFQLSPHDIANPILALPTNRLAEVARALESLSKLDTELEASRAVVDLCRLLRFEAYVNPAFSWTNAQQRAVEEAALALNLRVLILGANSDGEIEKAFKTGVEQHIGALAIETAPFFDTRRAKLLALQSQYRLPTAYSFREYAAGGGVMSYGPDTVDAYRQVGLYVGRILKGEKPADLPVMRPTKFELIINLNTAKTLGLTVPLLLLAQADEVIQ
jgi:putative ABC transport system substrate-binding protein